MPHRDPAELASVLETEDLLERGLVACAGQVRVVLDIGFGRGELLIELASAQQDTAFMGVEISRKRVEKVARRIARVELKNVRVMHSTAEHVVERVLPVKSLAECWINCPDPWPKKRHFKRRLIQSEFIERLRQRMVPQAVLHLATDHPGYAEWMHDVMSKAPGWENLHAPAPWSDTRPPRIATAYETEWLAEGRCMAYFEYRCQETR